MEVRHPEIGPLLERALAAYRGGAPRGELERRAGEIRRLAFGVQGERSGRHGEGDRSVRPFLLLLIALVATATVALVASMAIVPKPSLWAVALGAGLLALGGIVWRALRREGGRLGETVRACRGCGYDLTGLEDEIPPERFADLHVGPATCPECGRQWPLFPERPAAADEF